MLFARMAKGCEMMFARIARGCEMMFTRTVKGAKWNSPTPLSRLCEEAASRRGNPARSLQGASMHHSVGEIRTAAPQALGLAHKVHPAMVVPCNYKQFFLNRFDKYPGASLVVVGILFLLQELVSANASQLKLAEAAGKATGEQHKVL